MLFRSLAEAMEQDLGGPGSLEACVRAGEHGRLRGWLAERVYPLGRQVNGEALVQQVSGKPLTAEPFLAYLNAKVGRLVAP